MRFIEHDGMQYEVEYSREKDYCFATVRINGKKLIGSDPLPEMAYYALKNHVYQEFVLPKEKPELFKK